MPYHHFPKPSERVDPRVFPAELLLERTYCCGLICQKCPYDPRHEKGSTSIHPDAQPLADNCKTMADFYMKHPKGRPGPHWADESALS